MINPEKDQTSVPDRKRSDERKQRRQTIHKDRRRFTNLSFQSTYVCVLHHEILYSRTPQHHHHQTREFSPIHIEAAQDSLR
jgi:hypothetical protein